ANASRLARANASRPTANASRLARANASRPTRANASRVRGTPAGVGATHKPPAFLKPGDVVQVGIEGLGEQRQTVAPPRD
ncbi:MAG: fumarylacetoacetate hydrolase family protein, partial [Proteobacteria bacterium]|nr:fumarylacetoacetate hydrolase family protein [Pseudomonadota bacterium]